MKRKIISTADGSKTIELNDWNESYHSKHGAMQEALYVYLDKGWELHNKQKCNVLEIGFGTGLNAILTLIKSVKENKMINYTGIEAYPLSADEIIELDYFSLPSIHSFKKELKQIHQCDWNKQLSILPTFSLHKKNTVLKNYNPSLNKFDIIYFDAFGPRIQPEMWTMSELKKMYNALKINGVFVTYCVKGEVRRNLASLGCEVEKLPGPPGKREMLRAIKR